VPYRRKKLTFAILSPDEFLYWKLAMKMLVEFQCRILRICFVILRASASGYFTLLVRCLFH